MNERRIAAEAGLVILELADCPEAWALFKDAVTTAWVVAEARRTVTQAEDALNAGGDDA